MAKKTPAPLRRVRIPVVKRVARREGLLLVRHGGCDYALVPLTEIERLEDEEDVRDALQAEAQRASGKLKSRPFEHVCKELGIR